MSTSGVFGYKSNNINKALYQKYDSYPRYLGIHVLQSIVLSPSIEWLKNKIDNLEIVDSNDLIKIGNRELSYDEYLRGQNPLSFLWDDFTVILDDSHYLSSGRFCEYGYIINFDDHVFEFYKGGQIQAKKHRYTNINSEMHTALVKTIPLQEIWENRLVYEYLTNMYA